MLLPNQNLTNLYPELASLRITYNKIWVGDHVTNIDRNVHIIKERARNNWGCQTFYRFIPSLTTVCLVENVVMWFNYFSLPGGFISTLSTCTIIGGKPYNTHSIFVQILALMYKLMMKTNQQISQRIEPLELSTCESTATIKRPKAFTPYTPDKWWLEITINYFQWHPTWCKKSSK